MRIMQSLPFPQAYVERAADVGEFERKETPINYIRRKARLKFAIPTRSGSELLTRLLGLKRASRPLRLGIGQRNPMCHVQLRPDQKHTPSAWESPRGGSFVRSGSFAPLTGGMILNAQIDFGHRENPGFAPNSHNARDGMPRSDLPGPVAALAVSWCALLLLSPNSYLLNIRCFRSPNRFASAPATRRVGTQGALWAV